MLNEHIESAWGVPDWEDSTAYCEDQNWNVNRWRWEFIRRRQDIREKFDKISPKVYKDHLLSFAERPDSFPEGRVRTPSEPGFYFHTKSLFNGEPTNHPLPNPRIGDQPRDAIAWTDVTAALMCGGSEEFILGNKMHVGIDLSRPLEAQMKIIKEVATEYQVKVNGRPIQRRQHPEKWPYYLRVLDARACGASWSVIAGILPRSVSRTADTARSIYRQAESLCFNSWG